ncbi:MAG: hypothetical protein NVS4B8_23400 [Herpetosiphon sp.]
MSMTGNAHMSCVARSVSTGEMCCDVLLHAATFFDGASTTVSMTTQVSKEPSFTRIEQHMNPRLDDAKCSLPALSVCISDPTQNDAPPQFLSI